MVPSGTLKFLIDTGASSSLINPQSIINKKLILKTGPHTIMALNKTTIVNEKVEFRLFNEFGSDRPVVTFYLCRFHEYFDGLLGYDILYANNMQLNLNENILKRGDIKLKIYHKPLTRVYDYVIKANGFAKLKIPVDKENGLVVLEERSMLDTSFVGGLYEAFSWEIEALIENRNNYGVKLKITQPFRVEHVEVMENNNFESESVYSNNLKNNNNNIAYDNDLLRQIRADHLNKNEKLMLMKLINNNSDLFFREGQDLSFTNVVKHEIKTTDEIPIYTKTYRYPYIHKEEIQKQISDMLKQGIIRPSNSAWSSPVWVVPKKLDASGEQKWRVVIDYRKLNEKTIDDRYPLPNINEILDKLGRSMYFSTLDLASGFHQIEVTPEDIKKTAFTVENGHYEYTRMPFGLKNAPATFQRVMDSVLKELQNKICLVYMDDIIVFSVSLEEHMQNLSRVFNALGSANLKIQLDKSEFLRKEVEFLGHVVTEKGIKPNPNKIKTVLEYPIPKNRKEIKQFVGLLGYYRKFIRDFARLIRPITIKLKKTATNIDINDENYRKCFEACRQMLTRDPILAYPDFSIPFLLITDASNFAVGAVLSQIQDGKEHPICYASRTLNDHEKNYSTIEKELLAIVWATKYFRPYLYGRKFKIQTDHRPLNWLMSLKEPNSKLVRWRLKLEEFDYEIEYKPGRINSNADALSRIPIETNNKNNNNLNDDFNLNDFFYNTEIFNYEDNDDVNSTDATVHSAESDSEDLIPISERNLNYFKYQYVIKITGSGSASIKIEKPFKNIRKIITMKQFDNDYLIQLLKNHFHPSGLNAIYVEDLDLFMKIQNIYKEYFSRAGMKVIRCTKFVKDIATEEERDKIISDYHKENNHRGILESFEHIKQQYYFPKLKEKITVFINNCDICQTEKYERHPEKIKFALTATPKQPLEICHVDIFYPKKLNPYLTIIDKFSRYAQAYKLETRNAVHIKQTFMRHFALFGKPKLLVSDQESAITTTELKTYFTENNIEYHFTSTENSNSNSPVERFHSTLLEHLRILINHESLPLEEAMNRALCAYNNSISVVTKFTPFELFFGRKYNEPIDIDADKIREKRIEIQTKGFNNSLTNKKKYIEKLNENRDDPKDLPLQEKVFIRNRKINKLNPKNRIGKLNAQENLVFYDDRNRKYHKKKVNKRRKFFLQSDERTDGN